jgi:hypothetical protein
MLLKKMSNYLLSFKGKIIKQNTPYPEWNGVVKYDESWILPTANR